MAAAQPGGLTVRPHSQHIDYSDNEPGRHRLRVEVRNPTSKTELISSPLYLNLPEK